MSAEVLDREESQTEAPASSGQTLSDELRAELQSRQDSTDEKYYESMNERIGAEKIAETAKLKSDAIQRENDVLASILDTSQGAQLSEELKSRMESYGLDPNDKPSLLTFLAKVDEGESEEETPSFGRNTIKESDLALSEARKKLVYTEQDKSGRILHSGERKERIEQAQAEYYKAFTDNLVDILNIKPEDAIASNFLKQEVLKISLHQSGDTQLTEDELLGTYGHIIVDAVAREQFFRAQVGKEFSQEKPVRTIDKIRASKVFKGAVVAGAVSVSAAVLLSDHLPDSVKPAIESTKNALPFLAAYISARTSLDTISNKVTSKLSQRETKNSAKDIASDQGRTNAVLKSVYGEVEARPAARQATAEPKVNEERLGSVQRAFDENLREHGPRHQMYEASNVITIADQLYTQYGEKFVEGLNSDPDATTEKIGLALLQADLKSQREISKRDSRIHVINRLGALAIGGFAGNVLKSFDSLKSDSKTIAKIAGVKLNSAMS